MRRTIKNFIAWFICFFFVVGICMNIDPNGPLAVIALLIMLVVPFVFKFAQKDVFDKNKKEFSANIASCVRKLSEFEKDEKIAVVLNMQQNMLEVKVIQLSSKELYFEEKYLWASTYPGKEGVLFHQKLDQAYRVNTQYGRQDEKEKALNTLNKIVKYCAAELGPDYIGFIHFSFAPGGGGNSTTFNISHEGAGIDRVTVTEGGGAYFGPLGIICHKNYYEAYKPHICTKNDGHIYYTRRKQYFEKENQRKAKW